MNDNRQSDKDVASPLPNEATLPVIPLNNGEGQEQQPTMTEGFLQHKEDSDNATASHLTETNNKNNKNSQITHQEPKSKAVEEESIVSSTTETVPKGNDQLRTPSPILPTDTSSSLPPVPSSNETTMISNSDDTSNGESSDNVKGDHAIVTPSMQEDDDEDKSSHVVAVLEDIPRQSFQDVEAGMVIVDENEQGWSANNDDTNEKTKDFPSAAAAAATVVPKGNSFVENEDTTASEPSNGDFPETLNDVDAEQEVDPNNNNIMKKAPPTTRMILLQFIGCCVVTLLLVGGSAGAATYLLAFHEGDPPTMAPTVSLVPTVSAMPSSKPSAAPTISPSSSPSSEPTLSSAPSSMPSSSPTPDFRSAVENFLLSERNINVNNGGINQLAAEWIIRDRIRSGTISLDNILLQRFALVAMEYSLEDVPTTTASTTTTTARQGISLPPTEIATDRNECDWDGVVCDGDGKVIRVRWPRKNWSGEIPDTIRLLRNLRELDLSENDIRGPLPEELYGLPLLERLYLYKNSIGGTISTRIGLLSRLTHWHLSHNQLTGTIPEQLRSIDGTRPLKYFNVYSNQLSGPLPETLRLRNLVYLDVGHNQLTGRLPDDIGRSCVELRQLHLDHNQFRGTLPVSYNTVGNGRLRSLLINNNQLTGVVSGERTMFNNLFQFVLHDNQFTGIDPDNCRMIIPWGEMSEFKADCDICQCTDFFNLCDRFCGRSSSSGSDTTR
ncbi:two component regulator [Nitzschia inconspicua]|uniref:Two component regulator n=1 Tax=Nitzschia inconspicua TaxID=303405 RepID=A0A9K3LWE3_9STRA|nr:two component regulator [Nitzschia inconspicua]KAG7369337.1 two component regulator [Nitzschia inconspicua]